MSESASVPFAETKTIDAPERLRQGALGLIDISASTMANIGPAYSFYFSFGFLVFTAGIAAPLTIVAAIIAVALLGNTLAQWRKAVRMPIVGHACSRNPAHRALRVMQATLVDPFIRQPPAARLDRDRVIGEHVR